MPGFRPHRWNTQGRGVLRLLGTFDSEAAHELLGRVRTGPERDIVIDVTSVRRLDEVGVAALARLAGGSSGRNIALRGLSRHQLRVLRDLGAALSRAAA